MSSAAIFRRCISSIKTDGAGKMLLKGDEKLAKVDGS